MNLKSFIIICCSIIPLFALSQAVVRVDQQQVLYRGYKNPVDFAVFGYAESEVFLLPHGGVGHQEGNQWYWTPQVDLPGKHNMLRIATLKCGDTLVIDSATFLLQSVDLRKCDFSVNPQMSHSGLPAFKSICGLTVKPPFEYSHFMFDTMIRVLGYEVVVWDSLENKVQVIPVKEGASDQDQQLQQIRNIRQGYFIEIRKIELSVYSDHEQAYVYLHPINPPGLLFKEYNLGYGTQGCR